MRQDRCEGVFPVPAVPTEKHRPAETAATGGGKMQELIYIASPYSHESQNVMRDRFHAVCEYAGRMMQAGKVVYSPIAHSHPIAMRVGLPTDWEYWERFDRVMLQQCTELHVLQIEGWYESEGVRAEVCMAEQLGLPVTYSGEEVEA
jgi:hypothetical protein